MKPREWKLGFWLFFGAVMIGGTANAQHTTRTICDTDLVPPELVAFCNGSPAYNQSFPEPPMRGLGSLVMGALEWSLSGDMVQCDHNTKPVPPNPEYVAPIKRVEYVDPCIEDHRSFDCKYQDTLARLDARFGE